MKTRNKIKLPSDNRNRVPVWAAKGDMTDSKVYDFWKDHPLVTEHGYKPAEAHEAAQSQYKASRRPIKDLCKDMTNWVEKAAIVAFWNPDHRSIAQRFRDFAADITDLEMDDEWHRDLEFFTRKLSQAGRPSTRNQLPLKKRVASWLIANWVSGEQICHLNARQISIRMTISGIAIDQESATDPAEFIRKRMSELQLTHGKPPEKERGYSAHHK